VYQTQLSVVISIPDNEASAVARRMAGFQPDSSDSILGKTALLHSRPNFPFRLPVRTPAKVAWLFALVTALYFFFTATALADDAQLWAALKQPNHFGLLRHANSPGFGDPSGFDLADCSTQRNLSDLGKEQAERIGQRMLENGIASARLYSSQWCRCKETAELMKLSDPMLAPPLNEFSRDLEKRRQQTEQLERWVKERSLATPTLMITHKSTISALVRAFTSPGELVVVNRAPDGTLTVLGSILTL
jgi:broad specificity phosphatase PhoE